MQIHSQPRQQAPLVPRSEPAEFIATSICDFCPTVTPTTSQVFSPTHLPKNKFSISPQTENVDNVRVTSSEGMSIFDRQVFSRPFEQLYRAALLAKRSPENQEHFNNTGKYSPAAILAIDKFMAIVEAKSAPTPSAPMLTFLEGPLTLIEAEAWLQFLSTLPAGSTVQAMPATTWKPVNAQELRAVLSTEPAFSQLLQEQEGNQFVIDLMGAINMRTVDMLATDNGVALIFRFDSTYGAVSHVALGSLWRNEIGKLCMGIAHQESLPGSEASGGVWTGVVFNTFDTSSDYPGGRAPVIESIKLAGFPSVNVFPCPRPEAIKPAVAQLAGPAKIHPYGATDNWNDRKRGTLPEDRPFETCFNVTHKVLAELYDVKVSQAPTLPTTLWDMRPFTSMSGTDFVTVSIGSGEYTKSIDLAHIANEPADEIRKVFATIGEKWGLSQTWDVCGSLRSSKHSIVMNAGETGLTLPRGVQNIKFINSPPQLTLGDKPVLAGQTYSFEQTRKMVYLGKEKSRPLLIVAAFQDRAKL